MYEITPHPYHTLQKVGSSMLLLDSIIRSLRLTSVDSDNPIATVFKSTKGSLPIASHRGSFGSVTPPSLTTSNSPQSLYSKQSPTIRTPPSARYPQSTPPPPTWQGRVTSTGIPPAFRSGPVVQTGCCCARLCVGESHSRADSHTPLWINTARWLPDWSPADIQREEARRVVWSSLNLASVYVGHTSSLGSNSTPRDLWITSAENVILTFRCNIDD